jgi:hypothetical protein
VFNKNKKCLGSTLLDTLNYYMIYGKDRLMQDTGAVAMLTRIAVEAMFSVEPNITVVNAEGAIFLQIVFQIFQGTDVLNEYFEPVLDKVLERLKGATQSPAKSSLKKHLLQVFLAAMYYNASATLKYLEMRQVTKDVILELFKIKKEFRSSYEHKCFVIGLTNIIAVIDAPESITRPGTVSRLLQEILNMLEKVKRKEAKDALKKGNKQIQNDGDDENDSDLSDDDTDSADDDDESQGGISGPETQFGSVDKKGKRSRSNSNASGGMAVDDKENGLGMTNDNAIEDEKKQSDTSDEDDYDCQVSMLKRIVVDIYFIVRIVHPCRYDQKSFEQDRRVLSILRGFESTCHSKRRCQ